MQYIEDNMKKYAIPPEGCSEYLTPGKKYEIVSEIDEEFNVVDEDGEKIYCLYKSCSHLNNQDWKIVTESEPIYTLTINEPDGTKYIATGQTFDEIINKVETYHSLDIEVEIEEVGTFKGKEV